MDWIERCFGIAPDNGNGTLEGLILFALMAAMIFLMMLRTPFIRIAVVRFIKHLQQNVIGPPQT